MLPGFVKLNVVFPVNPTKRAEDQNDLTMREAYFRIDTIIQIQNCHPDDGSIMAKSHIWLHHMNNPLSVMETADEIIEMIDKVKQKC